MDPLREGVKHASAEPPVTTRGRLSSLFSGAFPGKFSCIRSACSARRSLQGRKSTHSARIHIINRAASIYCKTSSVPGRNRASTEWFWLGSRRMSPAAQHPEIASAGAALPHNALHGSFLATVRRTASAPRRWGPPQPSRLPALQLPKVPDLQNEARSAAPVPVHTADHNCTDRNSDSTLLPPTESGSNPPHRRISTLDPTKPGFCFEPQEPGCAAAMVV